MPNPGFLALFYTLCSLISCQVGIQPVSHGIFTFFYYLCLLIFHLQGILLVGSEISSPILLLAYSCLWGFCLSVVRFLTLFYTLCFLVEGILSVGCGIFSPILHLMSSCPGDSANWSQDFQPYFTPCVSLFNVEGIQPVGHGNFTTYVFLSRKFCLSVVGFLALF